MNSSRRSLIIGLLAVGIVAVATIFFRTGAGGDALWRLSQGGTLLLPLISISALIDSINPCAFSILLLTIAFLWSIGKLRSRILLLGGVYVLGIFIAYMLIGVGLLQVLHLFNTPHFMAKLGSVLLIALGSINIAGELIPKFPIRLHIPHSAHHAMARLTEYASVPTAFALGAFVGVCEFPCTGGPYLTAIGLLHDTTTRLSGFGYLLIYNVIFVLPLVVILALASNERVLGTLRRWQDEHKRPMRLWGGVAMIVFGFIILFL